VTAKVNGDPEIENYGVKVIASADKNFSITTIFVSSFTEDESLAGQ